MAKRGKVYPCWSAEKPQRKPRDSVWYPGVEGANQQLYGGWPMTLSGPKTWLETGELLTTPGSLRYAVDKHAG